MCRGVAVQFTSHGPTWRLRLLQAVAREPVSGASGRAAWRTVTRASCWVARAAWMSGAQRCRWAGALLCREDERHVGSIDVLRVLWARSTSGFPAQAWRHHAGLALSSAARGWGTHQHSHLSCGLAQRELCLWGGAQAFKDGDVRFLICTDVAARGIDIQVRRPALCVGCGVGGVRPSLS